VTQCGGGSKTRDKAEDLRGRMRGVNATQRPGSSDWYAIREGRKGGTR
jgi:hypothetical protein